MLPKSWASQLPWAQGHGARPRGFPEAGTQGPAAPPGAGNTGPVPGPYLSPATSPGASMLDGAALAARLCGGSCPRPPGEPERGEARAALARFLQAPRFRPPPQWLRRCRGDRRWRPQVSAGPGPGGERGPAGTHRHPPPRALRVHRRGGGHGGLPGRRGWGSPGGPAASEGPGRGGVAGGPGAAWSHRGDLGTVW